MNIDFEKSEGLIPVIVQDAVTMKVLMLGYMNEEAWSKTQKEGRVTFYSRSKNRLWTKGETSGNYLDVESMHIDCDNDTLLIMANPHGPICHKGTDTCFNQDKAQGFLRELEGIITQRVNSNDPDSYTVKLLKEGINKVAQKVGEEATEVIIEAKDENRSLFLNESADLLYHLLVLLKAKGVTLSDIEKVLHDRHK